MMNNGIQQSNPGAVSHGPITVGISWGLLLNRRNEAYHAIA